MKDYNNFDENNRFIIENYTNKKPFSSFLPGIAGLKGIPLWAFYVNRGQGICSFGINNKDNPIMEFFPAYKSYQNVELTGFRTFIKINGDGRNRFYEPFSSKVIDNKSINRMYVGANELEIEEIDKSETLKTNVNYFILPNDNIGALVRKVTVKNITDSPINIEIIDGMPQVIPFGIGNGGLKEIGHTLRAWMSVYNLDSSIPFYKLRASSADTSEVTTIDEGHFYLCFSVKDSKEELLKPIVDPDVIFDQNTSFSIPQNFVSCGLDYIYSLKQICTNKIPSGFFGKSVTLDVGESISLCSLIGHTSSIDKINCNIDKFLSEAYISNKQKEASQLVRSLTDDINTATSSEIFDEYCRQTYLDNFLRGGYPLSLGSKENPLIYYVYSRKHGDLERDYNFFVTEPEYYSSGNGNFRDINQNRRCDILFNPNLGEYNIRIFMNLIQIDGYNPLVINGQKLILKNKQFNIKDYTSCKNAEKLSIFLEKPFTLGGLYSFIEKNNIVFNIEPEKFMENIVSLCEQTIDAAHGEGYWTDHWTYNLDLIESYLAIYPDKITELLFEEGKYTYFDDCYIVKPRNRKYVLKDGKVRQLDSVEKSEVKSELISKRNENRNLLRIKYGEGSVYYSNLFAKLITLAVNKFSLLDPMGAGVEMEAGKPGWDDAMNGMPGIFGSSMAESYELLRLIEFIIKTSKEYGKLKVKLPVEVYKLMNGIEQCIEKFQNQNDDDIMFLYWDAVSELRENFRELVGFGIEGEEKEIVLEDICDIFTIYSIKLKDAILMAEEKNNGLCPTFFYYEVKDFEFIYDNADKQQFNSLGFPIVRAKAFIQKQMPLFLEGVVRGLKISRESSEAMNIYQKVKNSNLFDKKLNMYKINESLEAQPIEIGRVRAFTPGWLENETIWLHMEYKYILEVLKLGLYKEFFEDFKNVLIPFLNPEVYGRSIIENSSFIASSANPDEKTHGQGFVARLSGAAAEFISIWSSMAFGNNPFILIEDDLCLELKPILPGWLFRDDGTLSFKFLGSTDVTYFNSRRVDTFIEGVKMDKIVLYYSDGSTFEENGGVIKGKRAHDIRDRKVNRIEVYF